MTPAFERLQKQLKQLPGLGHRSAERIALHLLVERPERLPELVEALRSAGAALRRCSCCGHLAEEELCRICADDRRDRTQLCVVEQSPDILAMERAGAYRGVYHVLHGRLSPVQGIGPEQLGLDRLAQRLADGSVQELILALANDIESEATCHYIQEEIVHGRALRVSRIGFGLPSGGGLVHADAVTLRSALESRRQFT